MADPVLSRLMIGLVEALRALPESRATSDVCDRVIEMIRHLESQQLLPQANWNLGPHARTAGK